jgi:hypothetical protein
MRSTWLSPRYWNSFGSKPSSAATSASVNVRCGVRSSVRSHATRAMWMCSHNSASTASTWRGDLVPRVLVVKRLGIRAARVRRSVSPRRLASIETAILHRTQSDGHAFRYGRDTAPKEPLVSSHTPGDATPGAGAPCWGSPADAPQALISRQRERGHDALDDHRETFFAELAELAERGGVTISGTLGSRPLTQLPPRSERPRPGRVVPARSRFFPKVERPASAGLTQSVLSQAPSDAALLR